MYTFFPNFNLFGIFFILLPLSSGRGAGGEGYIPLGEFLTVATATEAILTND